MLYNGEDDLPEYTEKKLSDLFMEKQEKPQLELNVQVYNINYGKASELLEKSQSIYEYSTFIHKANENKAAGMSRSEAVKKAVKDCIAENIMAEYLLKNGSEVENMLYFEWKEEDAIKYAKEEGFEDGVEYGMSVGKAEGVVYGEKKKQEEMIRMFSKKLSPDDIAETLQVPKQYVLDVLKDDSSIIASEPTHPYISSKTE